ncbi:proline--tRNA ligase [Cellulomonas bogoriensis]|uniref:Proline--tRNA ligase n=1 Tax=Cellulomonas bogoriensis 69B4 = DSM 16987 TaxID=1386082 RepID=A0A0A0C0F4_9CELL|nr:proline--tRNA ligase [Cellulomonas bogoriensis]KGM14133.1 prolyl-tRNA synthetase [Cellulomonas bogoriensis 69B4 = DSM 16987]
MLLRMSSLFVRTLREDPADAEVPSHRLLVRAGYIRRAAPGVYTWLPLGLRVLGKVEQVVRQEMAAAGAQEVHFPALLPREPYEATGRWDDYGPNLFRLKDRREADYLLAPTHEEMFTLLVKDLYSSYKDLPVTLYQIQTKYRDEARPRAGLLRGREFVMKDAYSFDLDDEGLQASYARQREAYQRIFSRLGLEFVIVSATSGAMGGSHSEEFLMPTPIGEDTFVRSAGGYAANVEAVTTPAPDAVPFDGLPEAHVERTPGTPTIQTLVDHANAHVPRPDRPWQASDTLKNVVVALVQPDGGRELVVVGVPGDREVDMTRLAAAMSPAEVQAATEADLAARPELVKGYIGPGVVGQANTGRQDALRYLLDPRVVPGTRWVTGANVEGEHVFDLVAGRDFVGDGVVEAAEVRAGDPAPDGSGPLELARGIEIGHIFALGRTYAEALGLSVLDVNGKARTVTMGSYGIGVSRAVAALAESNHDEAGLAWPATVAPVHVHVVATGKDPEVFAAAEELAGGLDGRGVEVLLDDRPKVSPGVKFADAELLGAPVLVVVGRGLASGVVEVRFRRPGDAARLGVEPRREVEVAGAVEQVASAVAELLGS